MTSDVIDLAAARLRADCRAFTRRNLYHASNRIAPVASEFDAFVRGPLAQRLRSGPIEGLLPPPRRAPAGRLPREWDAYFPAAVLIVDRREIVDLFAASGVLVQARIAVVCIDGTPAPVIRWLQRGFRAGFRAPVGYLHDAATVVYPFALEPLRTLIEVAGDGEAIPLRDLGIPPRGLATSALPFGSELDEPLFELEAVSPAAIVAYAARQLAAMLPRDPWLAPIARSS